MLPESWYKALVRSSGEPWVARRSSLRPAFPAVHNVWVVYRMTPSSGADVLAGALQWRDATLERWTPLGELEVVTASVEVAAWCADTRPFVGQHGKAWQSVIADFRQAVASAGSLLASRLRDNVRDVMGRLGDLSQGVAAKQPNHQVDALIAAARPSAQALMEQLRHPETVVAAWTDLSRACLSPAPEWALVARARDTFVHLASLSGHGSRWLSMQLSWAVVGEPHAVEWLIREVGAPGPGHSRWVPLADRISLGARYFKRPVVQRRQGVWFALRRAMIRQFTISFGAINFYYAPILHAVASSAQRTSLLPAELQGDSPFGLVQMPNDQDVVFARVDLAAAKPRDPVREARDVLIGALGMVRFGGLDSGNWQLMNGHVHAVNGHVVHHAVFWPRDEQPRLDYKADSTVDMLTHRAAAAGITDPSDHRARELRAAIRWCDEAEDLGAAAATLLYVRVIELFASRIAKKQWYDFLDEYVSPAWVRGRMQRTVYDVVHGALHPDGISERSDDVAALRRETYTIRGSFSESTHSALLTALDSLDGMPGIVGALAVQIRGLRERVDDTATVHLWRNEVRAEWSALSSRLRRVRNSLAHGGPYTDEVIDSLVDYARDLARTVLNWGIDAMAAGTDVAVVAAERRDTAATWELAIPAAANAPIALFG